jgi:hypothetical protein
VKQYSDFFISQALFFGLLQCFFYDKPLSFISLSTLTPLRVAGSNPAQLTIKTQPDWLSSSAFEMDTGIIKIN